MKKRFALVTGLIALATPLNLLSLMTLVAFVTFAPVAFAQASTWAVDPAHSQVNFSIRHMAISNVHGRFGKVNGTIQYNEADVTKSTVQATIDVVGVDTGEPARDTHLKTADFFATDKFAMATFSSTSVQRDGAGLKIAGNLTLHGITKSVVLNVEGPSTPTQGMDKKLHTGFTATTTLNRTDFAIGSKFPEAVVSDAVKLVIELEAVKQ